MKDVADKFRKGYILAINKHVKDSEAKVSQLLTEILMFEMVRTLAEQLGKEGEWDKVDLGACAEARACLRTEKENLAFLNGRVEWIKDADLEAFAQAHSEELGEWESLTPHH